MHVGCELYAPNSLGSLTKDITYYFLSNSAGRATLTWFFRHNDGEWRSPLIRLPQSDFEAALLGGSLVARKEFHSMPPWLRQFEGKNISAIDEIRASARAKRVREADGNAPDGEEPESLRQFVDGRYALIHPLIKRSAEVLAADDPISEIGRHARSCSPVQNTTRMTVWFVAYLVTGGNSWSLLRATMNNGRWDRNTNLEVAKKPGRRPLYNGAASGYPAVPLKDRIEASYLRHVALGRPMTVIYRIAMMKDFGCKTRTDEDGIERIYQPENLPFPSDRQFSYHSKKTFGLDGVQQAKYGEARMRQKSMTSQGKFSERLANILEAAETDAQHVKERPRCLLLDELAPPLIFARIVDATTAREVGLGASIVSESIETYKAAAFTAVVKGSLLSRILDLPQLNDDNWPGIGLPPEWGSDRGPGASEELAQQFPIAQVAPSYQGQSKPTVETSHTKSTRLEGAPTYVASNLTTVEMLKREFLHVLGRNRSRDISDRLTPHLIAQGVQPNPKAMWDHLQHVGRVSAHPWNLSDAIRTFLRPVNFTFKEDGLYLHFIRFDSGEMREMRMRNRLSQHQQASVPGYIFPLCASIGWIETKDGLVEVQSMLPLRDDKSQLYLSIFEIERLADQLRTLQGRQREHAKAVLMRSLIEFFANTGKDWDSGKRRCGRPPKPTAAAKMESDLTRAMAHMRKAS